MTTIQPGTIDTAHSEKLRHAMVASQLRTTSVNDPRVVAAMAQVARERFVPANAASFAYVDTMIPLPGGRRHNTPLATGRLLTEAHLNAGDKVLLIGAAGGYAAAVLAKIVREVVAVESQPELVVMARKALSGVGDVEVVEGPLHAGCSAGAPYDVMVIDGAVEQVPDELVAQVRPGGRIAAGVVDRGVTRLAVGERGISGFGLIDFADCACTLLPGFDRPRGFSF